MPENVSIAYRGANYAIGQGPQFYGIWHGGAVESPPLEWWPLTPEGWSGAWARFASIEVPGTIAPVTQTVSQPPVAPAPAAPPPAASSTGTQQLPAQGTAIASGAGGEDAATPAKLSSDPPGVTRTSWIAAAVLGLGVVIGIVGLFPAYVGGASLASQSPDVVTHVTNLVAWSLSAVLIASGGSRMRGGALLGLGASAVTLGFFLADAGTPLASGMRLADAGLWLGLLGWLACTAGVVLALVTGLKAHNGNGVVSPRGSARHLGRAARHEIVPLIALVIAAIGAAIAFAPSWDRFALSAANGFSQVITAGNAFSNPGPVIAGDVLVMVGLVAVVIVAALWRPTRLGGALAAGAIFPLAGQAISAIVQIRGAAASSPLQFNVSPAQANQIGLTVDAGLTPIFWVFCAFLATMVMLCAWMLLSRESAPQQAALQWATPPAAPAAAVEGASDYSDTAADPGFVPPLLG